MNAASPVVRTTCPYCGVGCGLTVTRAGANAAPEIRGDPEHPANFGRVCSKGAALGETLALDDRLLEPEIRGARVTWDEALAAVADGFSRTIAEHGPDSVAFYVSGQLLTEDYYVANKLMKGFIGSANIDTNSRLCMASAVAGYKRAFGTDTVPNAYADLEQAELIVIVGSNTAWCHPVLYQRIAAAKEKNPALRIIVIDPRRTATCDIADQFLPLAPGTDVMLFAGLLNHLRREDALDWEFLDAHAEGFGAALAAAKETAGSIPIVAAACGLEPEEVARFYRVFARTPRALTLFSQGVNQSTSGTDKVNAIVNVHLATGRIGKPGAGPFSLTGQPNAMGGREVGGLATQLAAHMDFTPENCDRVQRFWRSPRIARAPGTKAVDLFDAVESGAIKAVWIMSTNPAVSMPDAGRVRRALERCPLVVVSDCVRRTDTTECATILLPAAAWGEKSGTVTNSERRISRQRAFMPAAGASRPDWWIVCEVAKRMGFASAFAFDSPAAIFREHAALSAFENDGTRAFDLGGLANVTDQEYDELAPVRWPVPAAGASRSRAPFADGRFFTPSGKAQLVATVPRSPARTPTRELPFVLNTGRVRDQWHTMTRTGASPRLAGRDPEPFVQVHPADAARYGLQAGRLAEIANGNARVIARVDVTEAVREGQLFVPMHWSAQNASAGRIGELIGAHTDPVSGQPELKCAPVRLQPYRPAWYGFALSRAPLTFRDCTYVARAKGAGYWRYELAGEECPEQWSEWATPVLGPLEHRIELSDARIGRYRGACVANGRLQACLFVAADAALPERGWLGSLFGVDELEDGARTSILAGRALQAGTEIGPIVCACFAVGRTTLVRAIRTQALVTVAEIGRALRAGTNCGSCVPELKSLIAAAAPQAAASS